MMVATKQNGSTSREGQPVKTLSDSDTYFIAITAQVTCIFGPFTPTAAVIELQVALLTLAGIL